MQKNILQAIGDGFFEETKYRVLDGLEEGFYKTRLYYNNRYDRGPWVPVKVWWQDGDLGEAGELLSDQILRCQWWPNVSNPFVFYEIDPLERRGNDYVRGWFFEPIDEENFKWLIALKSL